jgi:CubicO group peptidase (beta-lactamase class C family)
MQFKNDHWQHPVGQQIHYSNVGYSMLTRIIEKVSKTSYQGVLQNRIFTPLKMPNTSQASFKITQGKTTGYTFAEDVPRQHDLLNLNWAQGAADLLSTTEDLSIFTHALMQEKVLNKQHLQYFLAPIRLNTSVVDQGSFTYSFSSIKEQDAIRVSGSTLGYSCHSIYLPDSDSYIVVLSNSDGVNAGAWVAPSTVASQLAATLLALPSPTFETISIPKTQADSYIGDNPLEKHH